MPHARCRCWRDASVLAYSTRLCMQSRAMLRPMIPRDLIRLHDLDDDDKQPNLYCPRVLVVGSDPEAALIGRWLAHRPGAHRRQHSPAAATRTRRPVGMALRRQPSGPATRPVAHHRLPASRPQRPGMTTRRSQTSSSRTSVRLKAPHVAPVRTAAPTAPTRPR
jgi:hypothetical protein